MAAEAPLRLLEINIISAHDLPPVSKMLRTFAVAYINPDQKLTTRIDHHGHTNPTWNYKVAFHVDDKFLKQESATVTIEIYNLAWLRNLPIGTTSLHVNHLSPPLQKNAPFRKMALQVSRPSGHLQGTLNVGVQLIDNTVDTSGSCSPSVLLTRNHEECDQVGDVRNGEGLFRDYMKEEDTFKEREKNRRGSKITAMIDQTLQDKTSEIMSTSTSPESRAAAYRRRERERECEHEPEPEPEPEIKAVNTSCGNSLFSPIRPLPSEVAAKLKKGLYSTGSESYGSSVFEGWTDQKSDDLAVKPPKGQQWQPEDPIPLVTTDNIGPQWQPEDPAPVLTTTADHKKTGKQITKRPEKKKGLMSCFGNAYGFEFSFICGSKAMKEKKNMNKNKSKSKKKNRNVDKQNVQFMTVPEENLRGFYV